MVLPFFVFREKISDGTKNVGELNILDGTDSDILGDWNVLFRKFPPKYFRTFRKKIVWSEKKTNQYVLAI